GFPANTRLNLYLSELDGQPGGAGANEVYATTVSDRNGNYTMSFQMPSTWPDGEIVEPGRIGIVVANSDFSIEVSGSFNYTPQQATPTPTVTTGPTPTVTPTPTATAIASANITPN